MLQKDLKRRLLANQKALTASEQTMRDLYAATFCHKNEIMCEGHDGLRTYTFTYAQMDRKIRTAAAGLYARLGAEGKYIALEMENSPQWIVGLWAILMSGNKPYLVNLRYPQSLTEQILKTLNIEYILSAGASKLPGTVLDIAALEGDCPAVPEEAFADELAFSSSATSMNEVICFYTGKQVIQQTFGLLDVFLHDRRMSRHYKGRLKHLAFLPFYHVFGLFAVFFCFAFFGKTFVFLRDYGADTILKTCRRHQVTHIFAVPMLWHTIEKKVLANAREQKLEEKLGKMLKFTTALQNVFPIWGSRVAQSLLRSVTDKLFGRSVQFCISGGSSLRPSALELLNGLGYVLHNGYGMSEIGITSVELRTKPKKRNLNSIGKPFLGMEYKLDEQGVMWARGGYLCTHKLVNGESRQTPEWFCTGDIMTCRDGHYYIHGRQGDVVIGENGENINPDTIEGRFTLDGAKQLCVLGLEDELSLVVQVSPYITEAGVSALKNQAYALNDTLPAATAVKKFYFTFGELAPPTAIKVSRTQLKAKIASGEVKLTAFADLQLTGAEGEDTPLLRRMKQVIAEHLQMDAEAIGADSHIFYDLGATSLQYFSIISAVSEEFGLSQYSSGEIYCYTARELSAFIENS